jgi:hypothetical protein
VDSGAVDATAADGDFIWFSYRNKAAIEKRKISDGSLVQSVTLSGSSAAPILFNAGDYIWAFKAGGVGAWRVHRTLYTVTPFSTLPSTQTGMVSDGFIWLSDSILKKLYKIDPSSGAILATVDFTGVFSSVINGIASDADKIGLVSGDGIVVFLSKSSLEVVRKFVLPASYFNKVYNSAAAWPALVYAGGVWFIAPNGYDSVRIYRYDYDQNAGFIVSQAFESIESIATSPEGLWIANTHAYRGAYVYLVSYDGVVRRRIDIGTLYSISSYPKAYFAPNNKLWITDYTTKLNIVPRPSP